MNNSSRKSRLLYAAVAGLMTMANVGCSKPPASPTPAPAPEAAMPPAATESMEKHACKGMNACSGKGGCAVESQNECKGKNPCKGKGGCKTA